MLPIHERIEKFVLATGMHSTMPVEVCPPGWLRETNSNQNFLVRAKRTPASEPEWFSTGDSLDVDADTVVVGDHIMRRTGKIVSNKLGESKFIADFKDIVTAPARAKHIATPPLYGIDCLILEDGRTFFVNGRREDYIKIMISLGMATSGS